MVYKWRPNASQKRAFAEKMQNPDEAKAYGERKAAKEAERRSGSAFDYNTAGGYYVPTQAQFDFCLANMDLFVTPEEISAANQIMSGYSANEKVHHDLIHIVNEKIRANHFSKLEEGGIANNVNIINMQKINEDPEIYQYKDYFIEKTQSGSGYIITNREGAEGHPEESLARAKAYIDNRYESVDLSGNKPETFDEGGAINRDKEIAIEILSQLGGMVQMGLKTDQSWSLKDLNLLFNSFEDVNYHTPNKVLWEIIQYLQDTKEPDNEYVKNLFTKYHETINDYLKEDEDMIPDTTSDTLVEKIPVETEKILPVSKKVAIPERIELGKNLNPYQRVIAIRQLINEKGLNIHAYSAEELAFLHTYEGMGGVKESMAREVLDQYFTPFPVIEKMWGLAFKYGFTTGHILEPSAGTCKFLEYVPAGCTVDAYEVDKYSYIISKLFFPKYNIINDYFEKMFFQGERHAGIIAVDKKYDLVIGNPPYRPFSSKYSHRKDDYNRSESSITGATSCEQYFIMRGIDVLKPTGLLVFIIPNTFLANSDKYNEFKEMLAVKAELVDAYRLPNEVFPTVMLGTDIIVLKKRQNPTKQITVFAEGGNISDNTGQMKINLN
jgi:hypothetical protein